MDGKRDSKSQHVRGGFDNLHVLLAPFKKLYSSVDNYIVNSFRMEENLLINNNNSTPREGGGGELPAIPTLLPLHCTSSAARLQM
jgi:hypothetical protein